MERMGTLLRSAATICFRPSSHAAAPVGGGAAAAFDP